MGSLGRSDGHTLHALDATTGKRAWARSFPDESPTGDSTVAVANGVVYYQTDRRLQALSGATGSARRRWSAPVSGVKDAAPTVANGVAYAGRQAFDAATGRRLWGTEGGSSPAVVADGLVYASGVNNELTAFRAADR